MHILDNFMLPRDKYISAKNKIALEFWLRPKVLLKHFQVFILSLSVPKLNGGEELVYLGISF
jgi:hypothetical protein